MTVHSRSFMNCCVYIYASRSNKIELQFGFLRTTPARDTSQRQLRSPTTHQSATHPLDRGASAQSAHEKLSRRWLPCPALSMCTAPPQVQPTGMGKYSTVKRDVGLGSRSQRVTGG